MDFLDDVVDSAVDSIFERASGFVQNFRERQHESMSPDYAAGVFRCAACRREGGINAMEMVHPDNGFALCRNCFRFFWEAAKEKAARLSKGAARRTQGEERRVPQPPPQAPGTPCWELLGVSQDATIDEIKRAYRALAMQWHPDRVPPSAPSMQREHAQVMFQEITRARDVMLKVRSAPEG